MATKKITLTPQLSPLNVSFNAFEVAGIFKLSPDTKSISAITVTFVRSFLGSVLLRQECENVTYL